MDDIVTAEELSKILKINKKTLYRHASQGKLPSLKIGGSIRFEKSRVFEKIKDYNQAQNSDRRLFYSQNDTLLNQNAHENIYRKSALDNLFNWAPIEKNNDKNSIQVIDLFSGCGGMSLGFAALSKSNSAFRLIGAVDINEASLDSYASNFNVSCQNLNVADIASSKLRKEEFLANLESYDPDKPLVLIGCAPCQGFTAHRKKNWNEIDNRNDLIHAFTSLVVQLKPDCVIMENVPELLSFKYWEYSQSMTSQLIKKGYVVKQQIHNLAEFGVPQERFRALIVAMKKNFFMPVPLLDHNNFKTTRDAIFDLAELRPGERSQNDPLHKAVRHKASTINTIREVPKDGGSRPQGVGPKCLQEFNGFADVYGRLYWDRPAITITHYARNPASGRFVHPEQHRGLTMREAARLQSFPDGFAFCGSSDDIYRQIGEAVPPIFAANIAANIYANLKNEVAERKEQLISAPVNNSYSGVIAGLKMSRK